jgi:hypothetical protein
MQIDLTAAEIARIARLLHLANDAQDAELWGKVKDAHVALTDSMGAPVIQPNPVQTCAEGLSHEESMAAYAAVASRYGLRSAQRSRMDRAPLYSKILRAADAGSWCEVERLLGHAGIIE